jgi:hypothetical protein
MAERGALTAELIPFDGQLASATSNAVIGSLPSTSGRGPTQAKTAFGFVSDNHIDPDIGVEVFIVEPVT